MSQWHEVQAAKVIRKRRIDAWLDEVPEEFIFKGHPRCKRILDEGGVLVVRPFRPKQKGVECSVDGCTDWCVSNDLCAKHNMRERRKQEKYKAYVREYNKRYKRPSVEKICKCGLRFETARKNQVKCSACSKGGKVQHGDIQK